MADNKKNEILEEQRRARQEFLELKKMQSGEAAPPPKPSEIAIVPKTPKEKWNNFWFQYKWHVFGIAATLVVLAVLTVQCATRTKYDIEVVYFTYSAVLDSQTEAVADYISRCATDVNGDGEINVQVINCSYNNNSGDTQYKYTMMTKLQSLIAADNEALLYITDKESYKYLSELASDGLFDTEPISFGDEFYKATELEGLGRLPEDLGISCRKVDGTVFEDQKGVAEAYNAAQDVLEKIKNEQK